MLGDPGMDADHTEVRSSVLPRRRRQRAVVRRVRRDSQVGVDATADTRHSLTVSVLSGVVLRWLGRPTSTASAVAGPAYGLRRQDGEFPFRKGPFTRSHLWFWVDVTEAGLLISPLTIARTPWWKPSMTQVIRWEEILQVELQREGLDIEAEAWVSAYIPTSKDVAARAEEALRQRGFTEHSRPTMYPGRRVLVASGVEPDFRLGRGGETPEFRQWVRRTGRT